MATIRDWLDELRTRYSLREHAQGLIEYGLIISVVSIAAVVLIMAIGPRVASMFSAAGSSGFPSDRRRKGGFAAAQTRQVLARVVSLPVHTSTYRTQHVGVQHIGPTAQDFRAAFGMGDDDAHIAMVDANGVALAALQGLYDVVQRQGRAAACLAGRLAVLEAPVTAGTTSSAQLARH